VQTTGVRAGELLAAVTRMLGAGGAAALDDALALTAEGLVLHELVLHASAAALRTRVPRQPTGPLSTLQLPVRVGGRLHGVLTASAARPFTAADADLLAAVAAVTGLMLAAVPAGTEDDPVAVGHEVLDAEADRADLAAELEETLGLLVAARHSVSGPTAELVHAALAALRGTQRRLRAVALEAGLAAALTGLAEPGRVTVVVDPAGLDDVAPPVAVLVERVAQALAREPGAGVRLQVRADGSRVKFRAESAEEGYDACELDRWARRAVRLGGDLRLRPDGVELSLPIRPIDEGHHDDGPDL
jgi:hypothetical protein